MAKVHPKDMVEWRAGDAPSASHIRKGIITEILPGGIAFVRTKVEGEAVIEEIRTARLRKAELAKPVKVKKAMTKKGRKPAAKAKEEAGMRK
jgi:hypothetical protein